MRISKKSYRKTEILSPNGSEYILNNKETSLKCSENFECRKHQDSEKGSENIKRSKTRTSFKGSENITRIDESKQDNKEQSDSEKSKVEQSKQDKKDQHKVEETKVEQAKSSFLSYGYYDPNEYLNQEGSEDRKIRRSRRRKGNNYYNFKSLYPVGFGKTGSFMEKIPEYRLYESVHRIHYDDNNKNSFLSTEYNSVDENMGYDRSQQYDDSYVGENTFFISDETKLPTYIASFTGAFISVIVLLCALIYIWTKFASCFGFRKKSSKSPIKNLTRDENIDELCMAEKRAKNENLTKIEDYISGSKAGYYEDEDGGIMDGFDEYDGEYREGVDENGKYAKNNNRNREIYNYEVNGEKYINYDYEDDYGNEERPPDLVDELFESFENIKRQGVRLFSRKKNSDIDIGDQDDAEKLLMEDNDYINEFNDKEKNNNDKDNNNDKSNYFDDNDNNEGENINENDDNNQNNNNNNIKEEVQEIIEDDGSEIQLKRYDTDEFMELP